MSKEDIGRRFCK